MRSGGSGAGSRSPGVPAPIKKDTPVIKQQKPKEVNLFDFDDDDNLPMGNGNGNGAASASAAPAAALGTLSLDGTSASVPGAAASEQRN